MDVPGCEKRAKARLRTLHDSVAPASAADPARPLIAYLRAAAGLRAEGEARRRAGDAEGLYRYYTRFFSFFFFLVATLFFFLLGTHFFFFFFFLLKLMIACYTVCGTCGWMNVVAFMCVCLCVDWDCWFG
jgi:hypothetical protein